MQAIRFCRILFLALVLIIALIPSFAASETSFERLERLYLDSYTLVRQGFEDKNKGRYESALRKFQTARQFLSQIQSQNSQWQFRTIRYLIKDCDRQMQEIAQISPKTYSKTSASNVSRLIDNMIKVKKLREDRLSEPSPQRGRERARASNQKLVPTLTQMLKNSAKSKPIVSRMSSARSSRQKRSPSREMRSSVNETRFMGEKFEAIEAAYLKNKRELDQWKLQYSVLEEKAREEIQTLSSEFAKEKVEIESQVGALKQQLEKTQSEKAKQELVLSQVKSRATEQASLRVEELERALVEAQRVGSRAQEEAKIIEGKLALELREKIEQEFKGREKKILNENAKKVAALEAKFVQAVKEKVEISRKMASLQKAKDLNEKLKKDQVVSTKELNKLKEEKEFFLEQEKKRQAELVEKDQEIIQMQNEMSQTHLQLSQARSKLAEKEASVRNVLIQADKKTAQLRAENEMTIMNLLDSFKREKSKWNAEVEDLQNRLALIQREKGEVASGQYERSERDQQELMGQKEQLEAQKSRIYKLRALIENSEKEKKGLYEEVNRLTSVGAQLRLDLKRTEDVNVQLRENVQIMNEAKKEVPKKQVKKVVVSRNPKGAMDIEAVIQKVKAAFVARNYNKAMSIIEKSLKENPSNDKILFYQGLAYSRLKKWDKAIQSYEAAINDNPNMAKAFNNLGNLYNQQKKYGKAIENLKKATQIDPKLSEAYNNMGIVYSHLGQFDAAIKAFIQATDLNPKLIAAFYNLGQIYYQDKKWDAAQTSFNNVLALNSDHVQAKKFLAQIKQEKKSSDTQVVLEPEIN